MSFFFLTFTLIFLNGCNKERFDTPSVVDTPIPKSVSPQDLEVKEQFFKPIEGLNPIFQKIKDNLQNQDSTDNFVTAEWVTKHGVPTWDKILTGVGSNETLVQTRGSNSVHRLSFVPLKELRTNVIKSFIVVYHLEGNKFGYRLYNREALSNFVASNDNDKRRVINLLAVFAYFEKTINGKVETYFPRPFDINLVNIDVKIGNAKNRAQLESCIEILIYKQPIAYKQEWEIEIVCTDTGSYDWWSSSTGGGVSTTTVVFIDGSSAASSVAASMYSSLEPGGVPESVFLNQYPQYAALFNNIKQLKLYLPDIDVTDLELFVVNPEIVTHLTTFFAQGGSISDGVQHKNLMKENADYLAANMQAGFPTVGSEIWEKNVVVPFLGPELVIEYTVWCAVLKKQNPTWPAWKIRSKALWNTTIELVHTGFDILGLIPFGGEPFDFANGVLYTIQGDGLNATFSFAATLPIAGWASTGAKYAVLSVKTAIGAKNLKITRNAVTGFFEFSHAQQFRKMVGVTDIEQEAHHLIPKNVWNRRLVQLAADGKSTFFHGNHPKNGIAVKKFTTNLPDGIHANHPNYDIRLELYLDRELAKLTAMFGANIPPDEAAKKVIEIQDFLKALIQNNPNIKIDDLNF